MTVTTSTDDPIIPPPPAGWTFWYTMHWTTNYAHLVGPHQRCTCYLDKAGIVQAILYPGETDVVHADSLPTKLFVYRLLNEPITSTETE